MGEPLPLVFEEELQDPNGVFRYTKENDVVRFECRPKTILDMETQTEAQTVTDTKMAFDFHTTSPMSPFTGGFYMARFTDIGKTTFIRNVLTVYSSSGNMKEISKQKEVPEDEFDKELSLHFGLNKLE